MMGFEDIFLGTVMIMNKVIRHSLFLGFVVTCMSAIASPAQEEIVILNWTEYLDEKIVEVFEQRYQVEVRQVYFHSEAERRQKMEDSAGKGFDLIMTTTVDLPEYVKKKWIVALDEGLLPNILHVEPRWQWRHEGRLYAMPYAWGTLGIAWRQDLITTPIQTWQDLYQPQDPALLQRLLMHNDPRVVVSLALKSLGYSLNTLSQAALRQAEHIVREQYPYVKEYTIPMLDEHNPLVTGDIWMGMMYNGDVLSLQEYDSNIIYTTPSEGTLLWSEQLALSASAPSPKLALAFLNFLQQPEIAAKTAESLNYASPNKSAKALLPSAHLNHPGIYPPQEILDKSEFFSPVSANFMQHYQRIYARRIP
jgi:spermidine/putrescine transport system substrate-binding protein